MRWAMVGSGTRKARAISSVVSPPSSRSVRATRASVDSTGWQAVNISRRRSSPMSSSSAASRSGVSPSPAVSRSWPSSWCLRSISLARRRRSMARFLAAAISQAPGLSGMPERGHCSSAETRASCASSSARPTSRSTRARPAISFARSMRKTASMAPRVPVWVPVWESVAVTAADQTTRRSQRARSLGRSRAAAPTRLWPASGSGWFRLPPHPP